MVTQGHGLTSVFTILCTGARIGPTATIPGIGILGTTGTTHIGAIPVGIGIVRGITVRTTGLAEVGAITDQDTTLIVLPSILHVPTAGYEAPA